MVIGLTGGIGSGKSTVANIFKILGYKIFNSDEIAKQIYFEEDIKQHLIDLLGDDAYLNSTTLNKPYINSKIFSNSELLKQLNSIIHPAVVNKFKAFCQKNKNELIVKETALLFEANLQNQVDKIILVIANDELRIKRTMLRDNLSKEDVVKKMNNQLSQSEKIKLSHYIIDNNETELIIPQVIAIHNKLTNA
ncbi:MAG: dephospho-CoA kinase [Bacteroidota bacterium]|nr:dephospho-CoA kinase [Bacteroidota bacterium]